MFSDNEFRPLKGWLTKKHIDIEPYDTKARVLMIKRINPFLKKRIRCIRCNISFTKLPRRFLIEVVLRTTILINSLPRKDGVHPTLSPREIVTGKKFCVPQYEIGDYVQAHTMPKVSNGTGEERTVDTLYLGPPDNGSSHDVFKLSTKQKISARKVTLIPMTADIIKKVNIMRKEEGETDCLEFTDLFGNITTHDIELEPNPHGMFDDDDSNISDADFTVNEVNMNKELKKYWMLLIHSTMLRRIWILIQKIQKLIQILVQKIQKWMIQNLLLKTQK